MTDGNPNQLSERIRELEELNRLAQVLSGTEGVDETLAAIIRCSQSLCRAERGSIVLFDPTAERNAQTIVRNSDNVAESIDHTLNMLVAARDEGVRRFVYAASSSAYGDSPVSAKTEDLPANPLSPS